MPVPVEATGNPWRPDENKTATVPIPNAVIITNIEGPYTERDRKLWTFLVHAAWDDLLVKRYHEIHVSKIDKLFRELEGGHAGYKWIWESARRLTKTIVEWEEGPDTARLQGISNLMNAKTSKAAQETGILWFEIPALLSEVIKRPFRFSRIRLHFMIGLSGKYAVTLYELLESVVNMKTPVLEVELSQLRKWLKVPEGKLKRYVDLKRFVLEPALKQINDNPIGAGFTAKMQEIKEGRAVKRMRFSMEKTALRIEEEKQLGKAIKVDAFSKPISSPVPIEHAHLPTIAYEKAKEAAPGYDIYYLEQEWREWIIKKGENPENPTAAFVAFCRKKAKKNPLSQH